MSVLCKLHVCNYNRATLYRSACACQDAEKTIVMDAYHCACHHDCLASWSMNGCSKPVDAVT